MKYHLISLVAGFLMDIILGDPYFPFHPIRCIGHLISTLEGMLYGNEIEGGSKRLRGAFLVICVLAVTLLVSSSILLGAYYLNIYLGVLVESVMTYFILAIRSLEKESMKVHSHLLKGDIDGARHAVSMIVGRDTESLDEAGIIKAAVETVAENTSDGVVAPLIYTALLGPVGGYLYKAINTMDSMVGYHNARYETFGSAAAFLDDIVNYIPARVSALLMIAASFLLGGIFDYKNATRIYFRDRYNHKSPNSAQTESVAAGALSIKLAGDAFYFGKLVKKPTIGDEARQIEVSDIKRMCILMFTTAVLALVLCIALVLFIYVYVMRGSI